MDNKKIEELYKILQESKKIVFFGGAGVSTASGIPDFRGAHGLYNYTPEEIISHSFFTSNTKDFYEFYLSKMVYMDALPNPCHDFLSKLEEDGRLISVVTQNIDGLHQMAGSKKVRELHGSIQRNYCMKCNQFYDLDGLKNHLVNGIPRCECGGIIKPDVVLYEEPLNEDVCYQAIEDIRNADTMIIAGTSLVVYPAASYIRYFKGKNIIVINLGKSNSVAFYGMDVKPLIIDGKVEEYLNLENYEMYLKK